MLLSIVYVTAGFAVLYFGAEWLVKGARSIALNLNVSKIVVGLTLVAFGTSSPELFVNVVAAYRGNTGLALGNVAGSNLTNLCLGFGLCAMVGTLAIARQKYFTDLLFFFLTPAIVLFLFTVYPGGYLPYWTFLVFLVLIFLYLRSVKSRIHGEKDNDIDKGSLVLGILLFLVGCGTLYGGGELILYSATRIAEELGLSETIIGLTIVAAGTSIPDVMASLIAMRKKEISIAVGNLLGSNIFNILLVLGGTLVASGESLVASRDVIMDYGAVCITSFLFFLLVLRFSRIHRITGAAFIVFYVGYMAARILLR